MKKIILVLLLVLLVTSVSGYEIWLDVEESGYPDTYLGNATAYYKDMNVVNAYKYFIDLGNEREPVPEAGISKVWLYEDLFLGMYHYSEEENNVFWDISIVDSKLCILLSDDSGELTEGLDNVMEGRWTYQKDIDGGILEIGKTCFTLKVQPREWGEGVNEWKFYSADGNIYDLNLGSVLYIINNDCPTEPIPEFNSIAVLAIIGIAGLFLYMRK